MDEVRRVLTSPSNLRIHMTADVDKLAGAVDTPQSPWQQFAAQKSADDVQR
jgi:hypothetical protein